MAERGDVVQLRTPLGFVGGGVGERFVVVQIDALNRTLETTVGVPLDPAITIYAGNPIAVPVSAQEAGAERDHVAIATHPTTLLHDRLAPRPVGRLDPLTLMLLDRVLQMVLDLP